MDRFARLSIARWAALIWLAGLLLPAAATAQVVETAPTIPTVNQSVTIFFNADEGNQGLQDFTGDVYAHTGVFTSESPSEWTCVKNYWPTDDQHTGNRSDTQLERVEPNRYKLVIDDIRAFYNNNSTGCTLGSNETIQTMNFVFRSADGGQEAKTADGSDIIVDLGDADAEVLVDFTSPAVTPINPFVTDQNTTVTVTAEANVNAGTLDQVELFVNGSLVETTASSPLTYDLVLDAPGRFDLEVVATNSNGETASDAFYAVRAESTTEQAVPAGLEDGINYTSASSATLVLQAPGKDFVHVIGEFSDWEVRPEYQMKRESNAAPGGQGTRYWIELTGLSAGQEYAFQYLVDGEIRIADPYAEKLLSTNDQFIPEVTYPNLKPYPTGDTERLVSILQTEQPDFSFSAFERPAQKDLVIYELLVRDFIERHDYQTMQDTLAYLDRLGINAIELMPVSEFDGNESWGYNPATYFAPDKYYGPKEELQRFIDLAHQRGIAVILDVVYNHQTGQSPFIRLYNEGTFGAPTADNPWANTTARHPFNVFNDNNHESLLTQYWLDRVNAHWLTEYNVDGFRFDLSKGFTQTDTGGDVGAWSSYDQSRIDLLQRMADQIWAVDNTAYIILEHFAESSEEKVLAEYRTGDGLPGMMLWNNVHGAYNQISMGYGSNSDISSTYYKNRGLSVPNYVSYMESHDEQWMMYNNIAFGNSSGDYDVTQLETALERQQAVGALFFLVPGPRLMWQFGELGYGYGDNGEQCLRGDDCPAIAPGRTDRKPIRWDYRDPSQSPNRVDLYKTWSAMINLRTSNELFTSTNTQVDMAVGNNNLIKRIGFSNPNLTMQAVVIGNYDVTERNVTVEFPTAGTWYDFFSGKELSIESFEQSAAVQMQPGEFHIFINEPVAFPEAGLVEFGTGAPAPEAPADLQATGDANAETITVSWTPSTSDDVIAHQVYRGTSAGFDTTGARVADLGAAAGSFSDSNVQLGPSYYYRIVALDNDGARSITPDETSATIYPATISVNVSRSFGQGSRQQDYRLIALPGDVNTDAGETFSGTAGEDWQVYWDNGQAENFLQKYDGSASFDFSPGRGFWAISSSAWSVQQEVGTVALVTSTEQPSAIIRLRSGWNIISNPVDRDVAWSAVQSANDGLSQPLWAFDGSFQQATTFQSAAAGQAYYLNNPGEPTNLVVPYAGASSQAGTASSRAGYLSVTAELASGPDAGTASAVEVGTSAQADDGVDGLDVIAPPSHFEALSLQIEARDASAVGRQSVLKRSVRSARADGHVYDLTLHAEPNTRVQLRAAGLASGQAARLIHRETGERMDLASTEPAELVPTKEATKLTLIVGSPSFVEQEEDRFVPEDLTFWPTYPNPFQTSTTIEYTLPKDAHVTLEVYDILGRRVATLVDDRQRPGLHSFTWNGTGGSGRPLASGIYFGRLQVDGQIETRKMTILR